MKRTNGFANVLFVLCLLSLSMEAPAGETALTVVQATGPAEPLLQNGGFEIATPGGATNWQRWHEGYRVAQAEGLGGMLPVMAQW